MPYANEARQSIYQREWVSARRQEYLAGRKCERCKQASPRLTFIAAEGKTFRHRCWTWEPHRRNMELLKAWVVCPACRSIIRRERFDKVNPLPHGTDRGYNRGCHCQPCTVAHAAANRAGRLRRKLAREAAE